MRKVMILDFPSDFLFPPVWYGWIERWLYTMAISFKKLWYKVFLSWPLWRKEILKWYTFINNRILDKTKAIEFVKKYWKVDYLVAGHEYWHNKYYREVFEKLSYKSFTFQHMPNPVYKGKYFDSKKHFLFCYSDEMVERFKLQNPKKSICYTQWYKEEPIPGENKWYLVWLGRIDQDKALHYAILAAIKLNIPIYVIGKPVYDTKYYKKYEKLFKHKLVKELGVLIWEEKMKIIWNAACAVYTLDKNYIESGVATLWEFIASWIPVAGISWKWNDCVVEAVWDNFGRVFLGKNRMNDDEVIDWLVDAINYSLTLDRKFLLKKWQEKFNPVSILQNMLNMIND